MTKHQRDCHQAMPGKQNSKVENEKNREPDKTYLKYQNRNGDPVQTFDNDEGSRKIENEDLKKKYFNRIFSQKSHKFGVK